MRAWSAAWESKSESEEVAFLVQAGDRLRPLELEDGALAKELPLSVATVVDTRLALLLNDVPQIPKAPATAAQIAAQVMHTGMTVLGTDDERTWRLRVGYGGAAEILSLDGVSSPVTARSLGSAVRKALGYDGVLVDRRGEHFLLRGSARLIAGQRQFIVLAGSHGRQKLAPTQREPLAIAETVATAGAYAVVKIVVASAKGEDVTVGAKVLFRD